MMQHDDQLSGEESLRIIDSMISSARNQMTENGHLYLLWGWVVLFCSIGQYLLQHVFKSGYHWTVWLLSWVTIIYQVIYIRNKKRKKRVENYTDGILKYVWIVFAVLMILMTIQFSRVAKQPDQVNLPILVLYGMPTFLSGIILKFRPLVIGGISCWGLSLVSLVVPYEYYLLLVALSVIAAWIIPGYMLQSKYRKINAVL